MKNKNLLQFILFFSLWAHMVHAAEPLPFGLVREPRIRVTPIYYELIGIDIGPVIDKALKAANDNEDFKRLGEQIKVLNDEINGFEDDLRQFPETQKDIQQKMDKAISERDQLLKQRQDIKVETITAALWLEIGKSTITEKCENKRRKLMESRTRLTYELEGKRLSFEEKFKKRQELSDIKYELEQTAHACPILLDDNKRSAYDRGLAAAKKEPTGIFDAIRQGIERAKNDPPDYFTIVNDMVGKFLAEDFKSSLKNLFGDIPEATAKIFNQTIALRSIDFLSKPSGEDVRYWVGFSGLMEINKFDVRASMYIVQDIYGLIRMSFAVELPDYYKLSDLIPGFTLLDTFSLPKAKLIFSNFTYFDRVFIRKGLNFIAEVDFSGPLKVLSDMKEKSKYFKSLVFENEPALLSGYLPSNIISNYLETRFELRVPFHFGFDLRKISFIPQSISNVVQQITSDDFRLIIAPRERKKEAKFAERRVREIAGREAPRILAETPLAQEIAEKIKPFYTGLAPETAKRVKEALPGVVSPVSSIVWGRFSIEGEAGARVVLGTQPDPLLLTLLINLRPSWDLTRTTLAAAVNVKTMLELKWLAIGNAAIQLEWDTALMAAAAAIGLPFTGFGIRGRVDLGKPGESRAQFEAAGGFKVSTTDVPGLLFNVKGKNIRFADIINYASYLATKARILKAPIPIEKIPTITFHAVEGYAALADMKIGHKSYSAGLGLHVETELFKKKFGLKLDMSNEFRVSGFGYMPRFDVSMRGQDLFKLYDSSKPDRGPHMMFAFDPKYPLEGYFNVRGSFEVPAVRLKQDVQFVWSGWNLDADFESSVAGITVMFGARINTKAGFEEIAPRELFAPEREVALEGDWKQKLNTGISIIHNRIRRIAFYLSAMDKSPLAQEAEHIKNEAVRKVKTWEMQKEKLLSKIKEEGMVAAERKAAEAMLQAGGKKIIHEMSTMQNKLEDIIKKLAEQVPGIPGEKAEARKKLEIDPYKKYRDIYIRFGFKQDFAEYMTKISKNFLQKMKTAASNKLQEAAARMRALKARGAKGFDAEIERTRRSIAKTEERLQQAKETCAKARWYKKFTCAKIAAQQATLAAKKSYLNVLLKPTKAAVTGAAQLSAAAVQKMAAIQEFALENAIIGLELIQEGLNIFNIKEVLGEFSDQHPPILKRFVAEVHLIGEPKVISLYDVPFDFHHFGEMIALLTRQVMNSFLGKSMEYIEMAGVM